MNYLNKIYSKNKKSGNILSSIALSLFLSLSEANTETTNNSSYSGCNDDDNNIYNNSLYEKEFKKPKLRKAIKKSKKIIEKYYPDLTEKELNIINKEYFFLITNFNKDKKYPVGEFLLKFIKIGKKYNLSFHKSFYMIKDYYDNNILSKSFKLRFYNDFSYRFYNYMELYDKKDFDKRFNKLLIAYKKGELDVYYINKIFPELFEDRKEKSFFIFLAILGIIIFSVYTNHTENKKNKDNS